MNNTATEKQRLAHKLIHAQGSEDYATLAKKCDVSSHIIQRLFHWETGEHNSRVVYTPRESTLDKIIAGLS